MKKIVAGILMFCAAGCANLATPADKADLSSVSLTHNNYRVLKQAAQGRDMGFKLFGFIPIVPVRYGDAMTDLYRGVNTEGKSAALINVNKDRSTMYCILFSLPSITITADVVEFLEGEKQQ